MKNKGASLILVIVVCYIFLILALSLFEFNMLNNKKNKKVKNIEKILEGYEIKIDKDFNIIR